MIQPPEHLSEAAAAWWLEIAESFVLESHHLKLLTMAAEAWDRCRQAREILDAHGLTFDDRFGQPRARPECQIERDSRAAFARLVRELGLDVDQPGESRPPVIHGNAGRRIA